MIKRFLVQLISSCTDFKFYKSIFNQIQSASIKYLVLLSVVSAIIFTISGVLFVNQILTDAEKWIKDKLPVLEIKNGKAMVLGEQPFILVENDFAVVFDTINTQAEIPPEAHYGVLVTDSTVYIKQDEYTRSFSLEKVTSFTLDQKGIRHMRIVVWLIVPVLLFLLWFCVFFIAKIIQASITALIMVIFNNQLSFKNIFNIGIYALTPPTLLTAFVEMISHGPLPYFGYISVGMYVAFVIGGLRVSVIQKAIVSEKKEDNS